MDSPQWGCAWLFSASSQCLCNTTAKSVTYYTWVSAAGLCCPDSFCTLVSWPVSCFFLHRSPFLSARSADLMVTPRGFKNSFIKIFSHIVFVLEKCFTCVAQWFGRDTVLKTFWVKNKTCPIEWTSHNCLMAPTFLHLHNATQFENRRLTYPEWDVCVMEGTEDYWYLARLKGSGPNYFLKKKTPCHQNCQWDFSLRTNLIGQLCC